MPRKIKDHPDNRAKDGYPLGLPCAIEDLDPATIAAISRRHNFWTRRKMRQFIEKLCETGSVSQAAASVGKSRQSAYRIRTAFVGQPFDLAWEAALEFGLQQLAHCALDRAMNGVEEPVFHAGEQVGTRTRYPEKLTMFLLANPARIGRHPLQREALLDQFQDLMHLIEHGPSQWSDLTELAARADPDEAQAAQKAAEEHSFGFVAERSHYAAVVREQGGFARLNPNKAEEEQAERPKWRGV